MKKILVACMVAASIGLSAFPAAAETESVTIPLPGVRESRLQEEDSPRIPVSIELPIYRTGDLPILIVTDSGVLLYQGSHNPLHKFRPVFVAPDGGESAFHLKVYVDNRLYREYRLDFAEMEYELSFDRSGASDFQI